MDKITENKHMRVLSGLEPTIHSSNREINKTIYKFVNETSEDELISFFISLFERLDVPTTNKLLKEMEINTKE